MLVLTRKQNQSIVVDGEVVIRILDVVGNKVRLGISAPKHVTVDREEVAKRRSEFAIELAQPQAAHV